MADDIKKQFWEELDLVIQGILSCKKLFIGDFNGHIGLKAEKYVTIHGGFGYKERNNKAIYTLDFAIAYELVIVNPCFKKKTTWGPLRVALERLKLINF